MQDVPQRQRSLRAVFHHSWQLLTAAEQHLFRRLAVFRGGFTREAATAVTQTTLSTLAALLDKSLLQRDAGGRFAIPMALQTYALESLNHHPAEKTAVTDAHCLYFADWLHSFTQALWGGGQKDALTAVHAELENIAAAWTYAATLMDGHALQAMMDPLFLFLEMRNLFQEGADLFGKVSPLPADAALSSNKLVRVAAQLRQGHFQHRLGRSERAAQLLQDGLHHARALCAESETAFALNSLGYVAWSRSDYTQAETCYRESLSLYRKIGDVGGAGQVLNNLAILPQNLPDTKQLLEESLAITRQTRDLWGEVRALNNLGIVVTEREVSQALYEACLIICREIDNQFLMTFPLINLGHAARLVGDFAAAERYYGESLTICREIGYRAGIARSLGQLGTTAYHLGHYAAAEQYCREGLAISEAVGDRRGAGLLLTTLGMITRVQETAVLAQSHFEQSLHTFREAADRQGEAWPLLGLAPLALDRSDHRQARQHVQTAVTIFEAVGDQMGLVSARALSGVTEDAVGPALKHFHQALNTAISLAAMPLAFEVLLYLAGWYQRQGQLERAFAVVRLIGEQETAVSAHVRSRAQQMMDDLSPHLKSASSLSSRYPTSLGEILQEIS